VGGTRATWDLKTSEGVAVASGIYSYLIASPSGEAIRGKVAIVK
jgi:hypothetical protein